MRPGGRQNIPRPAEWADAGPAPWAGSDLSVVASFDHVVERLSAHSPRSIDTDAASQARPSAVLVTLHPRVGADQLVPWVLLLGATLMLRSVCAGRFIVRKRTDRADTEALTGVFNLTAGLTGLLIGACAGLFFAQVDHTDRLALTVLIFAWLALGVLTYAPFPRHAMLHGSAVLAQVAVAWALAPDVPGVLIAIGVLLYGVLMWRLSMVLSRDRKSTRLNSSHRT